MNSKYENNNLTDSEHLLNLTNENISQINLEQYIPIQTETYLGVRLIF